MNQSSDPVISVVSPAYNEAETLEKVIGEWAGVLETGGEPWEIVIADDGSEDNTREVLDNINEPRLKVITFDKNQGYGPAISAAMARASGKYLVTIDSDGQFDLADARPMIEMIEARGLDLVTGYRRRKQDSLARVWGDRVLNRMVRIMFGLKLKDTNCALKVIKKELADKIVIEASCFPTPTEVLVRATRLGARIGEAPVNHRPRMGGKSKLRALASAVEFISFLCYLRLQIALADRGVIRGGKNER